MRHSYHTQSLAQRCLSLIICIALSSAAWGGDVAVFTLLNAAEKGDYRHIYETQLVRLALENTVDEYGPYRIEMAPAMEIARAIESMRTNTYPNFVRSFGFDPELSTKHGLQFLKMPIQRGIVSYRTCLIPKALEKQLQTVTQLEDLKGYIFGTGQGWKDADILTHNGLTVSQFAHYQSLFKMTAAGRIELFCRGLNEVRDEYNLYKTLPGLAYNKTFSIYYPMPMLFYLNPSNRIAMERMEIGLQMALKDGSMIRLWREHYAERIRFTNINSRHIIRLHSPVVDSIGFDYQQYFFELKEFSD